MNLPRLLVLDDLGDLAAPQGSQPWSRAMHLRVQRFLHEANTGVRMLRLSLAAMEQHKAWQQLDSPYKRPFASLREYAAEKPPAGLGFDPDALLEILGETRDITLGDHPVWVAHSKAQALAADDTMKRLEEHGGNRYQPYVHKVDCDAQEAQYGTSASYLVRRLKRDAPAIAAALARGEYPSAAAAARAAGWPGRAPQIVLPADPVRFAALLKQRCTPEYLAGLREALHELLMA